MFKKFFVTILFILFVNSAKAKQIKIISDKLEIIRAEHISIFSGNVYAVEGNLEIWSEELIVTSSKDENEINIFFDINNFNLIGWQTLDVYQNLNITYLSSLKKNKLLKKNIFKLPSIN